MKQHRRPSRPGNLGSRLQAYRQEQEVADQSPATRIARSMALSGHDATDIMRELRSRGLIGWDAALVERITKAWRPVVLGARR